MNTPNKLTVLRMILVPFFMAFMMIDVTNTALVIIGLVLFVVDIVCALFMPIFLGLIRAGFYDTAHKAETPMILPELSEEVPIVEAEVVSEEVPVEDAPAE